MELTDDEISAYVTVRDSFEEKRREYHHNKQTERECASSLLPTIRMKHNTRIAIRILSLLLKGEKRKRKRREREGERERRKESDEICPELFSANVSLALFPSLGKRRGFLLMTTMIAMAAFLW